MNSIQSSPKCINDKISSKLIFTSLGSGPSGTPTDNKFLMRRQSHILRHRAISSSVKGLQTVKCGVNAGEGEMDSRLGKVELANAKGDLIDEGGGGGEGGEEGRIRAGKGEERGGAAECEEAAVRARGEEGVEADVEGSDLGIWGAKNMRPPPPPTSPNSSSSRNRRNSADDGDEGGSSNSNSRPLRQQQQQQPGPPIVLTRDHPTSLRSSMLRLSPGSDLPSSISALALRRRRGFSLLSGVGVVTSVSLLQPSGSVLSFDGNFEILSLSGAFLPPPSPPEDSGMTVFLTGPQGRIVGGRVAGQLLAVGTVTVFAATFSNTAVETLPPAAAAAA